MSIQTGLDNLISRDFTSLTGKRIAVLCNHASVDSKLRHIVELLAPLHRTGKLSVEVVFGPQHGIWGHTQDNMIEWVGHLDERTGFKVCSLYGTHREPTDAMLSGVDLLVADLPDVGSRYYTFQWTMALCMKSCARLGIPMLVLDRPNPIGGKNVTGTVLEPEFSSFVGLYPLPSQPGLTLGELARYFTSRFMPNLQLEVIQMTGWSRECFFEDTGVPWVVPSPNMPTVETAVVYPGGCLLEATNLSEGRGTTRPFETVGAPYLDAWKFCDALNALKPAGCIFRPIHFEPTFNKHVGKLCGGAFVHVTDRASFDPVLCYVAIMQEAIRYAGFVPSDHLPKCDQFVANSSEMNLPGFAWRRPPYEYEHERRPIDILSGNAWLADAIENQMPLAVIWERFNDECAAFETWRAPALLYG